MNFRVVAAFGLSIASVWASAETISLAPVGGDAKTEVSSADVVKVRGKGIGTTRDEALKDAYRDDVLDALESRYGISEETANRILKLS